VGHRGVDPGGERRSPEDNDILESVGHRGVDPEASDARRRTTTSLNQWAIEELNLGPHAYQARGTALELCANVHFVRAFRTSCSVFAALAHIRARSRCILHARMDTMGVRRHRCGSLTSTHAVAPLQSGRS
jgi:hypothetical protein